MSKNINNDYYYDMGYSDGYKEGYHKALEDTHIYQMEILKPTQISVKCNCCNKNFNENDNKPDCEFFSLSKFEPEQEIEIKID